MQLIALSSRKYPGLFTEVDDDDVVNLTPYKWNPVLIKGSFYVRRTTGGVYLHRFLTDAPQGMDVDHIDGNTLNNQRSNIRVVSHQTNQQNIRRKTPSKSGYRGVMPTEHGRWNVRLKTNGVNMYFGTYDTPEEAARVRDIAAKEYFGEHTYLNFPNE